MTDTSTQDTVAPIAADDPPRRWFSWEGRNYRYESVRGPDICGTQILLHCTLDFLKRFEAAVGTGNSTNLPNLLVLERPDNQWLILSLKDPKVASQFISRLNKWELKNDPSREETEPTEVGARRKYFIVEDRKFASSHRIQKGPKPRNP